ncbi:S28 family serine protease [uncultured Draconibacterium sp.]|uniref:S28 family serine protease n=1 Tax=uncultured Draconibacterium sp. TaxID=1573823 RepID=UPI0032175376
MKKLLLSLFITIVFIASSGAQNLNIEDILYELPDVIFKEIKNTGDFEKTYELKIKQPLDHQHPERGYFYQRAFLSHKDFNHPTVMYISGYSQNRVYETEITRLLQANQFSIEHRFFGESIPETLDYTYLTLEQATADLHHINEIFKQIYAGKWLSTGISKGGATTIFYKYFYPEDVDAGVPYVGPINREYEERRLYTFLDTVGSDECRAKILAFQKRIFQNREKVLPLLKMYSQGAQLKFTYLSFEEAFEYCVLEYPFAFWQYGSSCDEIPSESSSLADAVHYLMKVSNISMFSDRDIDYFLPHYYQSATQMGYYGYETEKFENDLKVLRLQPHPHAALVPDKIPVKFDGSLLNEINVWTQKDGSHLIYIYGANDTWTASAVPPSDEVDCVWFFMKGKDHGSARYAEMTSDEKAKFISTLERWLSIKIENTQLK